MRSLLLLQMQMSSNEDKVDDNDEMKKMV